MCSSKYMTAWYSCSLKYMTAWKRCCLKYGCMRNARFQSRIFHAAPLQTFCEVGSISPCICDTYEPVQFKSHLYRIFWHISITITGYIIHPVLVTEAEGSIVQIRNLITKARKNLYLVFAFSLFVWHMWSRRVGYGSHPKTFINISRFSAIK